MWLQGELWSCEMETPPAEPHSRKMKKKKKPMTLVHCISLVSVLQWRRTEMQPVFNRSAKASSEKARTEGLKATFLVSYWLVVWK